MYNEQWTIVVSPAAMILKIYSFCLFVDYEKCPSEPFLLVSAGWFFDLVFVFFVIP